MFGLALSWGIAIAFVATVQLTVALVIEHQYDRTIPRAFLLGALYPPLYWLINAAAAVRTEIGALIRGPAGDRVVWDIPREQLGVDPGLSGGRTEER